MHPEPLLPANEFAALHHPGRPLLLPNAWDHASGAALAAQGFPALGTTSLGVAAAAGLPDGAGVTRAETVALAQRLATLPCLLTVDIEAGFSDDPDEVAALTVELAEIGAAGVNLEDAMGDVGRQRELIAAAKTSGLFVNARTDTHWLKPAGIDLDAEALRRAQSYVDAGADGIFIPGMTDEASIATAAREIPVPLNILYSPAGPTFARLGELGVSRVSCGSLLFRAALDAAVRVASAVAAGEPVRADIVSYAEVERRASNSSTVSRSGSASFGNRP
ncbi:isocitrate lyase/phosphoenolpyruvate mutase family protein [Amycolatopsis acidicola]|uniref:Isocitrate lyase/phosphoenolpyruvate mutase family protein n=1 Tax=Amycolatopsis acidicola TaxID=2596893 RepID=A0A5N0UPF6_9PSEU|nr:isocitrate lyase/phosphoenolpyruvate mutase family protein [Amycolatopsis acidicola]KAA9150259.1 isocitrate lyase/phosphoenolpyruvate mutase family protein [Amycolatopsis acidicola]